MVDVEDQSFSLSAVLSRVLTRSSDYLNSHPLPTCSPSTPARCTRVSLPEPPALLPALLAAGARPEIAEAMQAAYHQRACEFREQALATISRGCSKLAQIPSTYSHTSDEAIVTAFTQIYLKKLNMWINEGVALLREKGPPVLRCRQNNENVPSETPKTFNHQFVPSLEHFFEENPFPAHADKVFLAKRSNMSYRQIHVWFQNRRNRAKKASHKKPASERITIPLGALTRKMGKFTVPPTTDSDTPAYSQNTPVLPPTEVYNVLCGIPPRHAFPTMYPPSCGYDPFPAVPTFPAPEWPRRPPVPSSERPRQFVVDVDELIEKFSRLNVWDDSLDRSRRKAGKMTYDGSAATSAITIKPSPAPHPARIRPTTVVFAPPRIPFQTVRATASSLHVFRSPSPNSPIKTLIPTLTHGRKISPLPKRIPCRPPLYSGRETSGSLTSPLSLDPEVSIQESRVVRNWSSSSSSVVTTPETSPSPLSHPT